MKSLVNNPYFYLGLIIKIFLFVVLMPKALNNWYVPFMELTSSFVSFDPWSVWINNNGSMMAFPYGTSMWLYFFPFSFICKIFSIPVEIGYKFAILLADFLLLFTLSKIIGKKQKLIILLYWLSPIIFFSCYSLGLNDLIPILFLINAFYFLKKNKVVYSSAFLSFAISAKLSMIIALPFFILYFLKNKVISSLAKNFFIGLMIFSFLLAVPFIFSDHATNMLITNPEIKKIYNFKISIQDNNFVFLVPFIYIIMIYLIWRVRRLNYDLLVSIVGIALLLIVLMTPASPGWFVWTIPFLVIYQVMSDKTSILLSSIFSLFYLIINFLDISFFLVNNTEFHVSLIPFNLLSLENFLKSLLYTSFLTIGVILVSRNWRDAVSSNVFFKFSKKPFVIGVSGDSGSGKDTFSDSIINLFGSNSVLKLSGDDYHISDRQKPIWQVMTHLNPMTNNLELLYNNIIKITNGKSILSRSYNHNTGKMSKPFKVSQKDFIIVSGLHSLYLPILVSCYDLKIFLKMDEKLRRVLKIKRDVFERGHKLENVIKSLKKREKDSEKFIKPQQDKADLIFSILPIHPSMVNIKNNKEDIKLKLVVTTRNWFNELSLHRVLVGICGLHVDIYSNKENSNIQITIEGDASSADFELASKILCPNVIEFLNIPTKWNDGVNGLMQLITLSHISQNLTKRLI